MGNTAQQGAAIQTAQTCSSFISIVACLIMANKINKERKINIANRMLAYLLFIDFVLAIFYGIGRAGTEDPGFCQFQGAMLQWFEIVAMCWVVLMAYQMHEWIVKKKNTKRIEKAVNRTMGFIFLVAGIISAGLLGAGDYGDSYLWCWIDPKKELLRFFLFTIILIVTWVITIYVLREVSVSLSSRTGTTSIDARIGDLFSAKSIIQRKLVMYVVLFIFVWSTQLLNRLLELGLGHPVFVTSFIQAIVFPLQGFFNSLCYGGYLDEVQFPWEVLRKNINLAVGSQHRDSITGGGGRRRSIKEVVVNDPGTSRLSGGNHSHSSGNLVAKSSSSVKGFEPKVYSIFTTTFNMGEAPTQSLQSDLKEWILEGHDVYAIGLQECIDLPSIRSVILDHLGGESKYAMFTTEIGSGNTRLGYHGFIALTVYVRQSELVAGHIHPTTPSSETMATGTDLLITTAQNKGAVGLPFQIHDTNIGFVTCHLPSDSKGLSKLSKRNASAHSILKAVTLAPEDLGFDLHLQHDHMLVFGDLNYRMASKEAGVNSLTGVAVASLIEKNTMGDDANWVTRRYNMLRSYTDPLHPSLDEIKLFKQARASSKGAWSSVLRADELRSIMDDGDAFSGFEEPMPCFAPSYKRRKGQVEGDCGDYTDPSKIIAGFSNTGDIESELAFQQHLQAMNEAKQQQQQLQQQQQASTGGSGNNSGHASNSILSAATGQGSPMNARARTATGGSAGTIARFFSPDDEDAAGRTRSRSPSQIATNNGNSNSPKEGGGGRSRSESGLAPSDVAMITANKSETDLTDLSRFTETEAEFAARASSEDSQNGVMKRRPAAVLVTPIEPPPPPKKPVDPRKLRPPSYTDRILIHSLPDRQDRLTVQAYDLCDLIRISDHRPVSMTLKLKVNAAVSYKTPSTVVHNVKKEPKFDLFELTITNVSVRLGVDGVYTNDDDEDDDEDDDDDDEPAVYRDTEDSVLDLTYSGGGSPVAEQNPMHVSADVPIVNSNNAPPAQLQSLTSSLKKSIAQSLSQSYSSQQAHTPPQTADIEMGSISSSVSSRPSSQTQSAPPPRGSEFSHDAIYASNDIEANVSKQQQQQSSSPQKQKRKKSFFAYAFGGGGEDGGNGEEVGDGDENNGNDNNNYNNGDDGIVRESDAKTERSSDMLDVVSVTGEKHQRKKSFFQFGGRNSIIGALISSNVISNNNHNGTGTESSGGGGKKHDQQSDEDEILKEMTADSLSWKTERPGEWRKKVAEEERRRREEKAASAANSGPVLKKLKTAKKKAKKSDDKRIDQFAVVFPLPSKDPLLSHRKMYDFSQAYGKFGEFDSSSGKTRRELKEEKVLKQMGDMAIPISGGSAGQQYVTRDELLRPMAVFNWDLSNGGSGGGGGGSGRPESKRISKRMSAAQMQTFKVKGCASPELGAHVLLKFSNKLGYDLGTCVVCLSHLINRDPAAIYTTEFSNLELSSGGQKRGEMSGKFTLKFLPSPISCPDA